MRMIYPHRPETHALSCYLRGFQSGVQPHTANTSSAIMKPCIQGPICLTTLLLWAGWLSVDQASCCTELALQQ
jgi:hypothetical protein